MAAFASEFHGAFVRLWSLRYNELQETSSHLWFAYHEQRLSAEEGIPVDEALRERVRCEYPVPAEIDFRMS